MMKKILITLSLGATLFGLNSITSAGLSADQLATLGSQLTPVGGKQAGNAEGTIPPWEGGITQAPAGFKSGGHHPDPFADDKILFTISSSNVGEHADKLTVGHKAMLKKYGDSFKMNIYPSRRSAAMPQRIYDATKKYAATAKLSEGGNGFTGAVIGIPFPIPENGLEAIWNHIVRYRGDGAARTIGQAPVTRNGSYTMVELDDDFLITYSSPNKTVEDLIGSNIIGMFRQRILAPPRLAGQILLVHETLDQKKEHRKAWVYNPGQRRVRRAPNVAFDNPGTASDGLRTSDQLDMYNGSPERYNWNLVGKKEMYVPYNAYKLHSDSLKYGDIINPRHMNPDHLRYELHRVWVVDATLKDGTRHVYKRRTFYIDEDSWQILAVDQYDNRDQLWRVSEGHVINYYDVPLVWISKEVHHDLQSGRYLVFGLNNEQAKTFDFDVNITESDFSTSALRRAGRR